MSTIPEGALAARLPRKVQRHLDDDMAMTADVSRTQVDQFLVHLGELVEAGGHTPQGSAIGLATVGYPSLVQAGAFATFTYLLRLVDKGITGADSIDKVETLMISLVRQARKNAEQMVKDIQAEEAAEEEAAEQGLTELLEALARATR